MSICKLNHTKSARKDQGNCEICRKPILTGMAYDYWQGRYTRKYVAHADCLIPLWMRETNPLRQEYMQAEDALDKFKDAETQTEAGDNLESVIAFVESIRDQLDERLGNWQGTNLEYSGQYQSCEATRDEMDNWLSEAESVRDSLLGLDERPDDLDQAEIQDLDDDAMDTAYEQREMLQDQWDIDFETYRDEVDDLPELDLGA